METASSGAPFFFALLIRKETNFLLFDRISRFEYLNPVVAPIHHMNPALTIHRETGGAIELPRKGRAAIFAVEALPVTFAGPKAGRESALGLDIRVEDSWSLQEYRPPFLPVFLACGTDDASLSCHPARYPSFPLQDSSEKG